MTLYLFINFKLRHMSHYIHENILLIDVSMTWLETNLNSFLTLIMLNISGAGADAGGGDAAPASDGGDAGQKYKLFVINPKI